MDPNLDPNPSPITPSATSSDWRPFITDELKADPVVAGWAEKASEKDIPSLLKTHAHLNKRMGSAINLPGADAKPEDVAALRERLYQAGVFAAPPKTPAEYGLAPPEALPKGVNWSPELAEKFATVLHKHGVPKAAVADLLPVYLEGIAGASQLVQADRESGMAKLRQDFGDQFDMRFEAAARMLPGIFTNPEEMALYDQLGLSNDARFLGPLMRLSALAMQDSSFLDSLPVSAGQITGDAATEEYARILNDKTHPMYEAFRRRDPKAEAYVDALYRKAHGNQRVQLDAGGMSV
jgi:hypothetical protein